MGKPWKLSFYSFHFCKETRSDGNVSIIVCIYTQKQDIENAVVPIAKPQVGGVDIGVAIIVHMCQFPRILWTCPLNIGYVGVYVLQLPLPLELG